MRREYIIAIVVMALIGGGVFAVYQFYLKERLEKYAKDQLQLEQLTTKYTELKTKFNNTVPKKVIEDVANSVNPWKEAVDERGEYFNVGDFRVIEPVPDDVLSYKLYYLERAPKVYNQFNEYLRNEGKQNAIAVNLWFRAPPPDRVTDLRPNKLHVAAWLGAMQYGHSTVKMFVEANVINLRQLRLWEPRVERQVLDAYTTGVEFDMTMDDLVAFFDKLRFDRDRYYDVNAFRIKNPYLKGEYANNPWLQTEMLITSAEYKPGAKVKITRQAGEAGAKPTGAVLFGPRGNAEDREEPKRSLLDRIMRLSPF